jgi:hypothetical protein
MASLLVRTTSPSLRESADDACGDDHLVRGQRSMRLTRIERVDGLHLVSAIGKRSNRPNLSLGEDLGALRFGEVEVVLVETVLGAVGTTGQAAAAARACRADRTRAAKEWIPYALPRLAKEDALGHRAKCVCCAHRARGRLEPFVHLAVIGVGDNPEHPGRGVVGAR